MTGDTDETGSHQTKLGTAKSVSRSGDSQETQVNFS